MEQRTILRYGIPLTILAILAGLYVGMHPLSEGLLTPPSNGFVLTGMLVMMGVAFFAAYQLAKDIPSRLLQRLTVLLVMAVTLYSGGVSGRGLYAMSAFSEPGQVESQEWMIMPFGGKGSLTLSNPEYRKSLSVAATPEAVEAAGMGKCVTISVEKSAEGDQRVAPGQKSIEVGDLSSCSGLLQPY